MKYFYLRNIVIFVIKSTQNHKVQLWHYKKFSQLINMLLPSDTKISPSLRNVVDLLINNKNVNIYRCQHFRNSDWSCERIFTSRKRSLGQGNIFTPVCHSVPRGDASSWGVLPPRCLLPGGASSWGGVLPPRGCASSRGLLPPGGCFLLGGAWWSPPPPTATAAGGTHPTGMHSCMIYQLSNMNLFRKLACANLKSTLWTFKQ